MSRVRTDGAAILAIAERSSRSVSTWKRILFGTGLRCREPRRPGSPTALTLRQPPAI
jgi:hypothetical protein